MTRIKVGNCYVARLSKGEAPVRIEEALAEGWQVRNLKTRRTTQVIKDQILRPLTDEEMLTLTQQEPNRRKIAVTAEAPEEIPVEIPTEEVLETTVDSSAEDDDIYETLRKKPRRKMTLLDAAHRVLTEYGGALTTGEIVEAALRKGYWQTEGKTPANTLNAAIARDIKVNGETSRFQKGERGHFLARETE